MGEKSREEKATGKDTLAHYRKSHNQKSEGNPNEAATDEHSSG